MTFVKLAVGAVILGMATMALAQDTGTQVWGVRVLATDTEAVATFYAKTFGMSEVARPVNTATTKEVILNFGRTPDIARAAATMPIVIYTRPAAAPAGAMASLILRVPDLDKAVDAVKANGGTLMREPSRNAVMNLRYAFVKDPDGNQIELIMDAK
jgi:predicted enzyme related to lactoylglutathione lyase